MLNLILTTIVAYYLVKTGDLFKLLRLARRFVVDLFVSLKKEAETATREVQQQPTPQQGANPIDILKLRYAKGELTDSEFEKMKSIF